MFDSTCRPNVAPGRGSSNGVVCGNKHRSLHEMREKQQKDKNMPGTCKGPRWLGENAKHKLGRWGTSHLGGHDMVRRVDRNGEALLWCSKCSVYARQRLGRKWMNRCKPENMDTTDDGKT